MNGHILPWMLYWLKSVYGAIWPALLVAAAALFLIHFVFGPFFARRKIQPKPIEWKQLRYEVLFASLTLGVGVLTQSVLRYLIEHKHATILTDPMDFSVAGLVAFQFLLYVVLFDIYFYFLHRLMHTDFFYKVLHKYHHITVSPDPITAFSFHPVEGLITGSFILIMAYCFDLHAYSITIVGVFATLNSVMLHSGHEIFPSWWYRGRFSKYYISPTYHDRHHQLYRLNLGAFTNIWDRIFGTMDPDLISYYDGVHARIRTTAVPTALAAGSNVGDEAAVKQK